MMAADEDSNWMEIFIARRQLHLSSSKKKDVKGELMSMNDELQLN